MDSKLLSDTQEKSQQITKRIKKNKQSTETRRNRNNTGKRRES